MRKLFAGLCLLPFLGCSAIQERIVPIVQKDLSVAIARGEKILGSDDALVVCYKALDEVIKAEALGEDLDGGLLLDAAMRARILAKVREKVESTLKTACSEIIVEVLLSAARRGR